MREPRAEKPPGTAGLVWEGAASLGFEALPSEGAWKALVSVLMRRLAPLIAALMRDYRSTTALKPESSCIKAPVRIKSLSQPLVFYSPVANF